MNLRSWKGYSRRAMGSVTVVLNDHELNQALEIGSLRFKGKDHLASSNLYGKSGDTLDGHVLGASGEIAFSKYFSVPVDKSRRMNGDSGVDFAFNTITVDVQTTKHAPGWLKYDEFHALKANVAVLVERTKYDTFVIAGWVERCELYDSGIVQDFGYGNRHTVVPDAMHSVQHLRRWVAMNEGRYAGAIGSS